MGAFGFSSAVPVFPVPPSPPPEQAVRAAARSAVPAMAVRRVRLNEGPFGYWCGDDRSHL